MKEKIIDLIKAGELQKAFEIGEEVLGNLKDFYYTWTLLQSRYQDKKQENVKGLLSQEKYTLEMNRFNAELLELILKIESNIQKNFKQMEATAISLKDKLQNVLINSYEILEILSEGTSTITYKAKERFEDDVVAVRVLKNVNLFSETEAFEEVNKVKKLQHRNIITIFGRSPKNVEPKYVLMDYIQGIDVQTLVLEGGPRPLSETRRVLLKICDALYYLHKRKIFNADLRAARILIDREGEPMVSPFTVFRTQTDNNYEQIVSNLKCMSYQRLASKNYEQHTPQSNQFSLGVIAFLLLTGELLFDSDSIIDLIEIRSAFEKDEKFRAKKLARLEVPKPVVEIVTKLLSPRKKDRFPNMLAVIQALKNVFIDLDAHQLTAQESYSRACSFNPQIMHSLFEKINLEDTKEDYTLSHIALKLHNMIGLIIETNAHKSYLTKVMELEIYANLFFNNFKNFKACLFDLLEEYDYLWNDSIRDCWEKSFNETYAELKNKDEN